jgi:hypothetical protein
VGELGDCLAKLRIRDLAIWIPLPQKVGRDPAAFFCDACVTLLRSYEEISGMEPEFYLKTVFSFPHILHGSLKDIAGELKDAFSDLHSCSIVVV